ncbi:MAG: hypothetical protein KIT84_07440 [Labilithrix sp.]|nr:hypothetical protein [Labilithrix sp.]MCW5810828.1 hypothetical protein [Labilithrix sp.]
MRAETLEVEDGAEPYVSAVEATPLTGLERWSPATRAGRTFVLAACAAGPCRLRYRYALREAARRIDELEVASEEREVIVAPPSTWLLTPPRRDEAARVRFRVESAAGTTFVTGVYRSREAPDAWDITLADLWSSPYSVFGPLRVTKMGNFELAIAPGKMALTDAQIAAWAKRAEAAVVAYYGTFPLKDWLLVVVPGRGRWIGEGKTLSGGGGAVFMRVGEAATAIALERDWVLTHEMTHLTFPTVARAHHWAEEGVATYVEPFARARIGWLTAEEAWKGLVLGAPNGLPRAGDEGLDRTHTWGRTYWGGAIFFLSADVEIRKRTHGRYGLEHALRGINAAGGTNAVRWPIAKALATGDEAVGVPVLTELYAKMGSAPGTIDLPALWRDLGVIHRDGKITFDDTAPSATIRRAITTP